MPSRFFAALAFILLPLLTFASPYEGVDLNFPNFTVIQAGNIDKGIDNDYDEYMKLQSNLDPETEAILTHNPLGTHKGTPTPNCQPDVLQNQMAESDLSPHLLSNNIQNWLNACQDSLEHHSRFGALLNNVRVKYRMKSHPLLLRVEFQLADGVRLKGLLALKDLDQKRPLVVSKCGLYCDALSSYTINNTVMHIFDEAPFNLLILASTTGQSFAKDNEVVAMGGFDGGEQIIQTLEILMSESSKLREIISSFHLHGLSLGGHDALMASVYASQHKHLPVKNVIATCPVVDLPPTLDSIFSGGLRGGFYKVLTLLHLRKVYFSVPILSELLDPDNLFGWSQREMKNAFVQGSLAYYKKRTQQKAWSRAPFEGVQIETLDQLQYLNNFLNHTDKVDIPTFVVFANDDQLVSPDLNSQQLKRKLRTSPNHNIGIIQTHRGNHCAFSSGIGWNTYSELLRSLVSLYKDDVEERQPRQSIQISDTIPYWQVDQFFGQKLNQLPEGEVLVKTEFKMLTDKDHLLLYAYAFDPTRYRNVARKVKKRCLGQNPFNAYNWCLKTYKAEIPISALAELGLWGPTSTLDKYRLSRWLNVNSHLQGDNGQSAVGSQDFPKKLSIIQKIDYAQ